MDNLNIDYFCVLFGNSLVALNRRMVAKYSFLNIDKLITL